MNAFQKAALFCALFFTLPVFAQVAVSGTRVQDGTGTGSLLTSGNWTFNGGSPIAVSAGAFSGTVTAGTGSIVVTNASSVVILTIPSVTISSTFVFDSYIVPSSLSISGTGQPLIACQIGALYMQTDSVPANQLWICSNLAGQASWKLAPPPPTPSNVANVTASENIVACSATPAFNILSNSQITVMCQNITSWSIPAGTPGQSIAITFAENATGGWTLSGTPANVVNFPGLSGTTPGTYTTANLVWSSSQNVWIAGKAGNSSPGGGNGSVQINASGSLGAAAPQNVGAAISDQTNANMIIAPTVPAIGWPLPSSIANDILIGFNAGQQIGNYTTVTTTGTAGSGSTTLTVASAAGIFGGGIGGPIVSGAGIFAGTTVVTIVGTTVTLSHATTASLSGTPVTFTPGPTGALIAIGNDACQHCQSNNGSVVIGEGAMANDIGNGTGGEDQNGVVIGPFAGGDETGSNCTTGLFFESDLIGNKVGLGGCGFSGTQMIGNHIFSITGANDSTFIGNGIGEGTTGLFIEPTGVIGMGRGVFNGALGSLTPLAPGTYPVSYSNCIGNSNCAHALASYNFVYGAFSFGGRTDGTVITGIHNVVIGDHIANNMTTGSSNILIGGGVGSASTANQISTGTNDVIIGDTAGQALTTANTTTLVGFGAGAALTTATGDAFGDGACKLATGAGNICLGQFSGSLITTGTANIEISSANAAGTGTSGAGSNNVVIGTAAGVGESSSTNTYVGQDAGRRSTTSLGTNEAFGMNEFFAFTGATGTEINDAFFGDSSDCLGCTLSISLGHAANIGAVANAVQIGTGTNSIANTFQYMTQNFLDSSANLTYKTSSVQSIPTIASAATIAPTSEIIKVSGTAAISTITPPTVVQNGGTYLGCVKIIPTGVWSMTASGNIAVAVTLVSGDVSVFLEVCYDGTKWYPSRTN